MKRVFIALTLTALVAVSFSSCKKTCKCTAKFNETGEVIVVEEFKTKSSSDCIDRTNYYATTYTSPTCSWGY